MRIWRFNGAIHLWRPRNFRILGPLKSTFPLTPPSSLHPPDADVINRWSHAEILALWMDDAIYFFALTVTYFWPASWLVLTDRANEGRCMDRCIEGRSSPSRQGPSERKHALAAPVRWPFSATKREMLHSLFDCIRYIQTSSDRQSDWKNSRKAWGRGMKSFSITYIASLPFSFILACGVDLQILLTGLVNFVFTRGITFKRRLLIFCPY